MLNAQKTPLIGSAMLFTLALASAVGCGSNSGKTSDPNSANPNGTTQQSATAEVNQALNSQAGQAYLAAAHNGNGNGPICQTELQAMEDAIKGLASNPNGSLDAVTSAIEAFAQCVQSQVANLPGMPIPGTSSTCMATVQNGNVVQTGDCSNCTVTQTGSSVSVMCSGSTSSPTIPGNPTNPNITIPSNPNVTVPTVPTIPIPTQDPNDPNGTTISTSSGSCMASITNGQVTQTGDCSHCKITPNGNSVSVSCQQSN